LSIIKNKNFEKKKKTSEVSLHVSVCVWNPLYDVRVDRVERKQRRFIRYDLRALGWTVMHDLPPDAAFCILTSLRRGGRKKSKFLFVFKQRSGSSSSAVLMVKSKTIKDYSSF
jgi:hypothetical protein